MVLRLHWFLLLLGLAFENDGLLYANGVHTNSSSRPKTVNIGALLSFNSTIGKVAKVAIQAAVDDVNSSPQVLHGTQLNISMQDSQHNGFLGVVEAMTLMENEIAAIIGPQSSVIAHVVNHIAKELQIPLLSFAATDPTLSSLQYPFFVRSTQNDLFQMAAIADIVKYFGWREVTAIYTDDDFGRNGIAALEDKLGENRCTISYKARMNLEQTREDITNVLYQVVLHESRVLVLHTYSDYGLEILEVARSLNMLDEGYVWIATNWLTEVMDTNSPLSSSDLSNVQGLLTLRAHTPDSELKRNFKARWSNLVKRANGNDSFGLNTFGLYAYDAVWVLAHALDGYFDQGGNLSFSSDSRSSQLKDQNLHFDAMSIFNGGKHLLSIIDQINITGLSGPIQFDSSRNLIRPSFDIINVIGTGHLRVGYWSNLSGLSVQLPEVLYSEPINQSRFSQQQLSGVIWPGQTTEKPRGWVFPNNGRLLRIGVPNRVDFREFISYSASISSFSGYCIDVFTAAVNLLPYAVPYKLIPFGNGKNNPHNTDLIEKMRAGLFDGVVGDISITTNRIRMADFTQPYIGSGLVVVAPVKTMDSNAWAFLRPFTPMMWCVTGIFFIVVGAVVWILEHRLNDEFRGPPRRQIVTILWFSCSTWFFAHRENTVSSLGRMVLVIWLFVVLIINSSYTASLTSILTVQQLTSTIEGIESLITSKDPIGYQEGSFAANYLHEELGIDQSRLIALKTEEGYAEALRKGPKNDGVAAIVDERAYMELFLSTRCEFAIVGREFTKNGWGFAFPRDSPLADDMSTAILRLSESGDLQRIHDKWLKRSACSSQDTKLEVDRLQLKSFWGLFLIIGTACLLALIVYFATMLRRFMRDCPPEEAEPNGGVQASKSSRLQTFLSFVDEKEEETKSRSKKRQLEKSSIRCSTLGYASNRSSTDLSLNSSRINHVEFSPSPSNLGNNQV